jgi:hypothetical protein
MPCCTVARWFGGSRKTGRRPCRHCNPPN